MSRDVTKQQVRGVGVSTPDGLLLYVNIAIQMLYSGFSQLMFE